MRSITATRRAIFLLAPLTTLGFLVGSLLLATNGLLPDPVAIHWVVSGQPDQFLDLESYLWLVTIGFMAFWSGLAVLEIFPTKARLMGPLLKSLLVALYFFILLVVATTTLMQVGLSTDESLFIGQWVVLVLVPAAIMVWLFSAKPSVVIQDQLEIRLRGFLVIAVPAKAIDSIVVMQLQARHYGGWGLRYAENTLALIPSSGRAILITLDWGEQIAVRMNEPDDFVGKYEKEIAG